MHKYLTLNVKLLLILVYQISMIAWPAAGASEGTN